MCFLPPGTRTHQRKAVNHPPDLKRRRCTLGPRGDLVGDGLVEEVPCTFVWDPSALRLNQADRRGVVVVSVSQVGMPRAAIDVLVRSRAYGAVCPHFDVLSNGVIMERLASDDPNESKTRTHVVE